MIAKPLQRSKKSKNGAKRIPTAESITPLAHDIPYVGRFAPSPTGPLHAGSLVAALASYLDAKAHSGSWLVRIDDIDPPREMAGAGHDIINVLIAHSLHPDRVDHQSHHGQRYTKALEQLQERGLVYACKCTRNNVAPGGVCISDCDSRAYGNDEQVSLRIRVPRETTIHFDDLILSRQRCLLGQQQANFILRRKDGLYAYQLAAACDDARDISHVIRGVDLLESTPQQLFLQEILGLPSPQYGHLPIVCGSDGQKLSKQTGATALSTESPLANLCAAAHHLGLPQAPSSISSPADFLRWSVTQWHRESVKR